MADIQCLDLCKTYRQGDARIHALDHVTLDIEPGSFICLSGPSGSGKTTLLNAIGGLDELDAEDARDCMHAGAMGALDDLRVVAGEAEAIEDIEVPVGELPVRHAELLEEVLTEDVRSECVLDVERGRQGAFDAVDGLGEVAQVLAAGEVELRVGSFASNSITVLDLTDPAAPVHLSTFADGNAYYCLSLDGDVLYLASQGSARAPLSTSSRNRRHRRSGAGSRWTRAARAVSITTCNGKRQKSFPHFGGRI